MKKTINIRMNEQEYEKYNNKIKQKRQYNNTEKGMIIIMLTLIIGASLLAVLINDLKPDEKPKDYGTTTIQNIPIPNKLIYFLITCIGVAWIFHGFGFIIIRG